MGWKEVSKGDPKSRSVQNGIQICRWGRTGWGQRAAQEVAAISAAGTPKPHGPRSHNNLGKVVPRRRSPALPVPGSCCRRKVRGGRQQARRGGARWGRDAQEMPLGMLLRILGGCPGDAAQDSRGMLPGLLGRCCPRCSEGAGRDAREVLCSDAREVLGRCSPMWVMPVVLEGCSGDAREVFPGMMPGIFGGCSRGARQQARRVRGMLEGRSRRYSGNVPRDSARDVRGCSRVAHRLLTETLGGCSRDARGMLPRMLGGGSRGCSPACSGDVSRRSGAAGGPARRCSSDCAPRAPLRAPRSAPRLAERRGRREAAGRGGGGVSSPALPQARIH